MIAKLKSTLFLLRQFPRFPKALLRLFWGYKALVLNFEAGASQTLDRERGLGSALRCSFMSIGVKSGVPQLFLWP